MATPRSIRYLNEVRALNALFRRGGMSRADLARRLNLNRASVGYIIRDLLAAGLVRERSGGAGRAARARAGRPGIVVELDSGSATFLGVEIGVDHIAVVAIDLGGKAFLRRSVEYRTSARSPAFTARRVAELVGAVARSLEGGRGRIQGVCVAIPALVRDGTVVNGLMLGWRDVPLGDLLREALGRRLPVLVENDANALAIGETYGMASNPTETVVCLDIENGAGGGIVIGGELFRGATGFSGELGQLPLGGAGFTAGRPRSGHLESYIGKDAILARYRANGGPATADLPQLLAALEARDRVARRTAAEWGQRLAHGLTLVVHVINPGRIVLGGSVAAIYPHVAERVREDMRKEFLEGFPLPAIEVSRLGAAGTAFGAACLLHQQMFSVDERLVHAQGELEGRRRLITGRRGHGRAGGRGGEGAGRRGREKVHAA
ncbi:MAG TPA: ROK family transcriptional regulator [Anaeromyxobacter sp.]|nr:ROK family transcriptional regulator [Anaeromyxobacter sp.]